MNDLKTSLLSLDIFIDNEYLDKYCELIQNNYNKKFEKYKCQKHHIIPVCYYKHNNLIVDNTSKNKVVLLHYEHVLAHIYLQKCSKEDWFKFANSCAVQHTLNNSVFKNTSSYSDEKTLLESLKIYQELLEDSLKLKSEYFKGHEVSFETRNKIRNSLLGTTHSLETKNILSGYQWYTNGVDNIKIFKDETIPEGFYRGRTTSDSWRRNVALANSKREASPGNKNKICVHKNLHITYVDSSELQSYLESGYIKGRPPMREETKLRLSKSHKGKIRKPLKAEHKKKISESSKGKKISQEQKELISKKNLGRKYVYKDGIQKFVSAELVKDYLDDGWILGRVSRLGHTVSQDTKDKISNKLKGRCKIDK